MSDAKAAEKAKAALMEKIVSLCKRRGFIFQSSEIYGGLNGCWDYGPLGAELKRNLKDYWWRKHVQERDDIVGLDGAILTHREVLKASGHLGGFSDALVDCKLTKMRFRADQVEPQTGNVYTFYGAVPASFFAECEDATPLPAAREAFASNLAGLLSRTQDIAKISEEIVRVATSNHEFADSQTPEAIAKLEALAPVLLEQTVFAQFKVLIPSEKSHAFESAKKVAKAYYEGRGVKSPVVLTSLDPEIEFVENSRGFNPENGAELTEPRAFNLMFQTRMGASSDENDESAVAYLRPETAQSIFVQFKNVLDSSRVKLPFGIAQIGKSFRNEINPRNFTFRSREFEQMEIEYFCKPEDGLRLTDEWLEERLKFYEAIGIPREHLHILDVPDGDRAFYSKKTYDIEYEFPFGIQELEGVAYRTDYDLSVHAKGSGKPIEYFDEETKEKLVPHVVEPSAGCDRTVLALICEAYDEETVTDEKGKEETRIVMRFHPRMAPIKAGIFPLLKNKPELVAKAREVQQMLSPLMTVFYDESGAIGRRYRRQDEVGTPYGITIDFDTLGENGPELKDTVTVRERDSMSQERMKIADLPMFLLGKIR